MMRPKEPANLFSFLLRVLLNLICIVFTVAISTFLGSTLPVKIYWIMAFVICALIVVMFYAISYLMMACSESIKEDTIPNVENTKTCDKANCFCCGMLTFNSIKSNFKISPNDNLKTRMKTTYSLFFQEEVLENEEKHFFDKRGKEIWIVSSTLSSEVDGGATALVGENLNRGVVYREFYAVTDTKGRKNNIAEENIKQLKRKYGSRNMIFVPYNRPVDGISGYLFDIVGFVIYIYENERNAYFSIRRSLQETPIYYRMPWCMGERYYDILNNIQSASGK